MNTLEITNMPQTEEPAVVESKAIELEAPRKPSRCGRREAPARYGLLLLIALVLGWLALSVLSSINEINADIEAANAKLLSTK